MTDTKYITPKATAQLIRKAIKTAFPGVKFSVRVRPGGSAINVSWVDGPTLLMVDSIAKRFQGARFDGREDLTSIAYGELDGGKVHFGADYVFTHREISKSLFDRTIDQIWGYWGWASNVSRDVLVWHAYGDGKSGGYYATGGYINLSDFGGPDIEIMNEIRNQAHMVCVGEFAGAARA